MTALSQESNESLAQITNIHSAAKAPLSALLQGPGVFAGLLVKQCHREYSYTTVYHLHPS